MSHIAPVQHETVKDDLQVYISAILSDTIPYVVPSDNTLVRAILVDLACYVRQLEADLSAAKSLISVPSASHKHPRPLNALLTMTKPTTRISLMHFAALP